MTISSLTNRIEYLGNGAVSNYSFPFKIFADADLLVTQLDLTGVETTLVLNTNYTVTGAGVSSGGSITLLGGALVSGYGLVIRRKLSIIQATDIRNQGPFFPETHENQFDKLVMIDQAQQNEIDRSMKLPESVFSSDFDPTLPTDIADSPGAMVIVNSAGDGLEMGPTAGDIAAAQANGAIATAAAAQAVSAAGSNVENISNCAFTTSVAASAMTIVLTDKSGATLTAGNPAIINFRSSTATSAVYISRSVTSAIQCVIPSTATMGQTSAVEAKLYVYAIDNAGTVEMAVSGAAFFDADGIVNTTILDTSSDSPGVMYSNTARTGVAYRLIGIVINTQATAGTWASAGTSINREGLNIQALSDHLNLGIKRTTGTSVGVGSVAISNAIGTFDNATSTFTDVTNLTVTLATSGKAVRIYLAPTGNTSYVSVSSTTTDTSLTGALRLLRDSVSLDIDLELGASDTGAGATHIIAVPSSSFAWIDTPAAGTYVYKVQSRVASGDNIRVSGAKLIAHEL